MPELVSQTLCIKCLVSAVHIQILYNFLTLQVPLKDGIGPESRPQNTVTLHRAPLHIT
jgi:hypothetical protein